MNAGLSCVVPFLCLALLAEGCRQTPARVEPRPIDSKSFVEAQAPRAQRRALNGGSGDPAAAAAAGHCVTLVAQDPFAWSWSLRTNSSGVGVADNGPVNLNAEICFDAYQPDAFSVAISGNEKGAIVDLGTADELADRFHFSEFMGGGRGFASIQSVNGRLMICAEDPNSPLQPLSGPDSELRKLQGCANAPVREGHIYLVRLEIPGVGGTLTAKLFVTAHEPRRSVSFRWLPVEETNKNARDAGATRKAAGPESAGTLTTLYANDPLGWSLDLRTGQAGCVVQDGEVRNHDSHICLGYYPDCLTAGIQGGDMGAIVDLGTLQEAAKALSMPPVGNSGNAYVGLPAAWARAHAELQKTSSTAHAPIRVGHLYVVRIVNEGRPDLFAKVIVLDFQPGAKVTLRWQLLGD